ncbi:MAG: DUF3106 domain-containing protein [Pseudomonadota bacterium]|nr:DUF3106 domain-containing protein [Pseudomonadota bacterium]
MKNIRIFLATCLLLASAGAFAGDKPQDAATTAQLPAWEQLSAEQRERLVAPLRERWNANPAERSRMYRHAERWQSMTPEQRKHARRGLRHWEHMDPERRAEMKALFQAMKSMSPEKRKELRKRWHAMTPEQRREWVEANPPKPR